MHCRTSLQGDGKRQPLPHTHGDPTHTSEKRQFQEPSASPKVLNGNELDFCEEQTGNQGDRKKGRQAAVVRLYKILRERGKEFGLDFQDGSKARDRLREGCVMISRQEL